MHLLDQLVSEGHGGFKRHFLTAEQIVGEVLNDDLIPALHLHYPGIGAGPDIVNASDVAKISRFWHWGKTAFVGFKVRGAYYKIKRAAPLFFMRKKFSLI
jgi:hypothetical protein